MSEIKLLPCPFCGGEASISNNACKKGDTWLWSIECANCGAFMDDEYDFHVIDRWNTRKPMQEIVEILEEELDYSTHNYKEDEVMYRKGIRFVRRVIKKVGGMNGKDN